MKFATCHPESKHYSQGLCKTCWGAEYRKRPETIEKDKAYRLANQDKSKLRSKRWYEANKEHAKFYRLQHRLENKEKYNELSNKRKRANPARTAAYRLKVVWEPDRIGERPSTCAVCTKECVPRMDHCHETNRFRGWLCNGCNIALGHVKNNPDLLRELAKYLENFTKEIK